MAFSPQGHSFALTSTIGIQNWNGGDRVSGFNVKFIILMKYVQIFWTKQFSFLSVGLSEASLKLASTIMMQPDDDSSSNASQFSEWRVGPLGLREDSESLDMPGPSLKKTDGHSSRESWREYDGLAAASSAAARKPAPVY